MTDISPNSLSPGLQIHDRAGQGPMAPSSALADTKLQPGRGHRSIDSVCRAGREPQLSSEEPYFTCLCPGSGSGVPGKVFAEAQSALGE